MPNNYFQTLLKEHSYNLVVVMKNYLSPQQKLTYLFKNMLTSNRFRDADLLLHNQHVKIDKLFNDQPLTQIFLNSVDEHFTYTDTDIYISIWKELLAQNSKHFLPEENLLYMVLKMKSPIKTDLIKELFSDNFDASQLPNNPIYEFCKLVKDEVAEDTQNCIEYLIECKFDINERVAQRRGLLHLEYTCLDLAIRKNNKVLAAILLNCDAESNFIGDPTLDDKKISIVYNTKNETLHYVTDYMNNVGKIINMQNYLKEHKKM